MEDEDAKTIKLINKTLQTIQAKHPLQFMKKWGIEVPLVMNGN